MRARNGGVGKRALKTGIVVVFLMASSLPGQAQPGRTERKVSAPYRSSVIAYYESPDSAESDLGLVIFRLNRGEKYGRFKVIDDSGSVPMVEIWQDHNFNGIKDINGQDLWVRSCGPNVGPLRLVASIEVEIRVFTAVWAGPTSGHRGCDLDGGEGIGTTGTVEATFSNLP